MSITALTDSEIAALRTQSEAAKTTSYSPYSNFPVGCAILTNEGRYVLGANVENASYPVGTCAERVAFGRGVVDGDIKAGGESVRAIGVSVNITPAASPCGMCRQFIREFTDLKTPIYMFDVNGDYAVRTLEELLPLSFGPEHLARNK